MTTTNFNYLTFIFHSYLKGLVLFILTLQPNSNLGLLCCKKFRNFSSEKLYDSLDGWTDYWRRPIPPVAIQR